MTINLKILKELMVFGIVIFSINMLMMACSYAGQDGGQLKEAHAALGNIIGGYGGKIVALSSLALGLIGSAVRFNPYAIAGCFGTCMAASLGVSVVNNTITALI